MSLNQTSLPKSLNERILEVRKHYNLTKGQIDFLMAWFEVCGSKRFGFQGVNDIFEEFKMAIKLLQSTELEWQERIKNNDTHLDFPTYFHYKGIEEGIRLCDDFNRQITEKLIGGLL